jgi:hypothetical protein
MAILQQSNTEVAGGFAKPIEESAMSLMMDILQKYQYQYPIKSTIRELVSNGLDSVTEKNSALAILSGKNKVEDFYEIKEGSIYADSGFHSEYYAPKWLSPENKVTITYHQSVDMEKDFVTVTDRGVGLGLGRLAGYFRLGYSSKRLSKLPIGKFGIGGKSPLSVNSYYTMESCYNGEMYRFNIYSNDAESIIPPFDLSTGKKHTEHVEKKFKGYDIQNAPIFEDYVYYSIPTTELNRVTITMEAKKHHLQEYKDAVEKQLMYFKNVDFFIKTGASNVKQEFSPTILYEDEYLTLSDNRYYNRPHILLNNVNYGYINFQELELEEMLGNIGIKVQPEDVEVSPSRESLVWSEQTKAAVLQRFKDASTSASRVVKTSLQETDFIRWVHACHSIKQRWSNSDTVLGRLANIVDLDKVKVYFDGTDVMYSYELFKGFKHRHVGYKTSEKANKITKTLDRQEQLGTNLLPAIVLKSTKTITRKDKYLLSLHGNYSLIEPPMWLRTEFEDEEDLPESTIEKHTKHDLIWKSLLASEDVILYEDVEVPDSFNSSDKESESEDLETMSEEAIQEANLSLEARRKLTGKTLVYTPMLDTSNNAGSYKWQKVEVPLVDIDNWEDEEIYYGNDADAQVMQFVAGLTRDNRRPEVYYPRAQESKYNHQFRSQKAQEYKVPENYAYLCTHFFEPGSVRLIKVAQDKVKLYKNFKHIRKFFARMNGTTLTMSNKLIRWNTARQLKEKMHLLDFMHNVPGIAQDYRDKYNVLTTYVKANWVEISKYSQDQQAFTDMVTHLDKVQQFQLLVKSGANSEEIALVAKELWNSDQVHDGCSVDYSLLEILEELLDWSKPVRDMFNSIPLLTGHSSTFALYDQYRGLTTSPLPTDFEDTVMQYCRDKNVI